MFNAASKRSRPNNKSDDGSGGSGAASKSSLGGKSNIKSRSSTLPPTTVDIENIQIHFPFKPYDVQTKYMASVIQALNKKEHGLLESPTGTGKTLCLLCSTLAWQQQHKGKLNQQKQQQNLSQQTQSQQQNMSQMTQPNEGSSSTVTAPSSSGNRVPTIIYASRTHSQLSQVVGELRNTRYRPRHAVLGSREHMCIHPKVNPTVARGSNKSGSSAECNKASSTDVNNGCNKLNKDRKCMMRNNLEDATSNGSVWQPP